MTISKGGWWIFLVSLLALLLLLGSVVLGSLALIGVSKQNDTLSRNSKASTSTRIDTVASRCGLTSLDVQMSETADPSLTPAYRASLEKCQYELAVVININRINHNKKPLPLPSKPLSATPSHKQ